MRMRELTLAQEIEKHLINVLSENVIAPQVVNR